MERDTHNLEFANLEEALGISKLTLNIMIQPSINPKRDFPITSFQSDTLTNITDGS